MPGTSGVNPIAASALVPGRGDTHAVFCQACEVELCSGAGCKWIVIVAVRSREGKGEVKHYCRKGKRTGKAMQIGPSEG